MKLTIFLIFSGLLTVSASIYSQATKLTLDLNSVSILSVPSKAAEPLQENSEQQQKKALSGTVKDDNGLPLPGVSVLVKGTTIGTITNANGQFTLSVPTDAKILLFSFIGMNAQEIPVSGKSTFNVVLKELTVGVEEVVVVGYGVQKKESIVGSIVQTSNEQLKRSGGVTDLKQALAGNLPGVTTITSSGEPGGTRRGESATAIFIRGQNTWNGGQPLILVDGVEREMDNIDVNEVESISVLKDASATAVFGVKGANGVILITTKRGTAGKPKLSFSYNSTGKMLSKLPQKMDSYNAILTRNEAIEREVVLNEPSWPDYIPNELVTRYKLPQTPEYAMIYPNVNWEKAMFKDLGLSHRATMNVQGGTNFVKYFGSLSYLDEGDMFKEYDNGKGYKPNYDFTRFNFRSNLDFKLTKTTNLKVNLSGYYSQKNTNNSYANYTAGINPKIWSAVYAMPPDAYLPQYPDGRWGWAYNINTNPVAYVNNLGIRETRTTELNSDFALEQNLDFITKGLSAKASLYYDNSILSEGGLDNVSNDIHPNSTTSNTPFKVINPDLYTGPDQDPSEYTTNLPVLGRNGFDWRLIPWTISQEVISPAMWSKYIPITRRMMYQFQINYARKFNLHNLGAMGVVKREEYAQGSMFKNYREDWVFRATYDYDSKYLFEMNGAYNGSEQFGPGYRFDFFPSLALGWVVSNEKFFKVEWINKLKLRFSTGIVGDDKGSGGRWLYASQLSYGGKTVLNEDPNGFSPYTWYKEATIGNPDIHWEKARKDNFGLEIGLFNNLISANYDYFTEDRTDILLAGSSRSIPPFFGGTPPSANIGHVKSSGHEIELKFDKRTNNGLHYWATLALAHVENKILDKDDPLLLASYAKAEGYSIGQTRSQIRAGFYNNWDQVYASVPMETNDMSKLPGFYNILDFNADGVIKATDDRAPYGYSQVPQNTFNTSLGADYKGFSVMVQFYGVNNVSRYVPLQNFSGRTDVVFDHVADYWSKDNQDASSFLPRWKTAGQNIGDYFIYDGSYIRLKTAEIAYTFQGRGIKKAGLSGLRIFLNGNNLLFWSKLPDDREASFSGGSDSEGAYPTVKRINLGFDLTF
ncbi:MAG: TonB-dependent receptor [Bacteroidota bacterium]|nr:TonB-dependent receptor [Bacteroidota bacterium]